MLHVVYKMQIVKAVLESYFLLLSTCLLHS